MPLKIITTICAILYLVLLPTPVFAAPVASDATITLDENSSASFTVSATGCSGRCRARVMTSATNGILTQTADFSFTYTPNTDFVGNDSFTYRVFSGRQRSNVATITFQVNAVNTAPVAVDDSDVLTFRNTAVAITLTATDADGDSLTFAVNEPSHGTLSGNAPNLTYTPDNYYTGSDSFTFTANDGTVDSNTATVTITVDATNDVPTANSQTVTLNEDEAKAMTLTGADPEGANLSYTLVTNPSRGTLSGTAPNLTYTPNENFNGSDSFKFKVNDGSKDSATSATVSITVNAVNDTPTANAQNFSMQEDVGPWNIVLTGDDVDSGDSLALTASIVNPPAHGTASITAGTSLASYSPETNFNGTDSFTFKVCDASLACSAAASVGVTVNAVNDAPTANNQVVSIQEDTTTSFALSATDVDSDALTATVYRQPYRGSLSISYENNQLKALFTPTEANYYGTDSFTYQITDAQGTKSPTIAEVSVEIQSVNDVPTVEDAELVVSAGATTVLALSASDVEGTELTYSLGDMPDYGMATLAGNVLTYTANLLAAADTMTFTVSDGEDTSAEGKVTINISAADAVVPIAINDLEPIGNANITVSSDRTVVKLADDDCYQLTATPLILPLKLNDGQMVEVAVALMHQKTLEADCKIELENYNFFVRTDTGKAYVLSSEMGYEPNGEATGTFLASSGMLITPLTASEVGSGLMVQQAGDTAIINTHDSRSIDTSVLAIDGVVIAGSVNPPDLGCEESREGYENCGSFAFVDPNTETILDMTSFADHAYEAWYSGAATRVQITDEAGQISYNRLAWGTGPGGDGGSASTEGGACTAFLTNTDTLLDSVLDSTLPDFDFFAEDLRYGARSFDPGDDGCTPDPNADLESAIQGEITPGFNPDTGRPTYWVKSHKSAIANSEQTPISQLDEDFNLVCEAMIDSTDPFGGFYTGLAVAEDGTVFTNAIYRNDFDLLRTGIVAIDPRTCATTVLVEATIEGNEDGFGGVTLAFTAQGESVALAAAGGLLYVHNLDTQETLTYSLGAVEKVNNHPVIDSAGRVIVASEYNTVTIFNLGFTYGEHFWPRFRKDNFGTATVEIMERW